MHDDLMTKVPRQQAHKENEMKWTVDLIDGSKMTLEADKLYNSPLGAVLLRGEDEVAFIPTARLVAIYQSNSITLNTTEAE
jgi:hypothetical protein